MPRTPKKFNPDPFPYHHEIELDIETLTNLGVGLGRINGWVVMIPETVPGDRVRARVFRNMTNYSEADLIEVLQPGPNRVKPVCQLFGRCGGCQYQHLDYQAQLEWKRDQIESLMQRIAGIACTVEPTHPSPLQFGYRTKLTPHYQKPPSQAQQAITPQSMPIGFLHRSQRHTIVDIPECPIASDAINAALPRERERVRKSAAKLKRGGTLLLRDAMGNVETDNNSIVTERVGGLVFSFAAGDFFQNNTAILPGFIEFVLDQAANSGASFLVDAFCGAGLFAMAGASRFQMVFGIEVNSKAIQSANANARLNSITNADFSIGNAETIFQTLDVPGSDAAVIIDPPRSGCDEAFLQQLVAYSPRRIIYVSCDPATQARDLKFLNANGFTVRRIRPFDLFPQTRHIESVAVIEPKGLKPSVKDKV